MRDEVRRTTIVLLLTRTRLLLQDWCCVVTTRHGANKEVLASARHRISGAETRINARFGFCTQQGKQSRRHFLALEAYLL